MPCIQRSSGILRRTSSTGHYPPNPQVNGYPQGAPGPQGGRVHCRGAIAAGVSVHDPHDARDIADDVEVAELVDGR
ncbi:MAG TPA: hypothetical protein VGK55_07715, partial [Actinomycetes bacterium]